MRKTVNINEGWRVARGIDPQQSEFTDIDLPYTWNGTDGQDGGNDYLRTQFTFIKELTLDVPERTDVYVEFKGVNSSAQVYVGEKRVTAHDGGYSTFRADITPYIASGEPFTLRVIADNAPDERVYPQTADFTFYGGIYRDVNLIFAGKDRFDLDFFGGCGLELDVTVDGDNGILTPTAYVTGDGTARFTVLDGDGNEVGGGISGERIVVRGVRLWNGVIDPYLYTVRADLVLGGVTVDSVSKRIGFRTVRFDPKLGFFLNGKSYPLHGVSRHQDRPKIGNALQKCHHVEDMELIKEIGANTVRLAHYQHDDFFYDLCDEAGMIVWAEIPYISRHIPSGNANAERQMRELIVQQHTHPCIAVWGISNEITMFGKHRKDMLAFHRRLNALVHEWDKTRPTVLACFAMCGPMNKAAHITDVVAWNLYLGWYVPFFFLNDLWIGLYHLLYPKSCLGYSEYGAEAMPGLHSARPKRGDNSEEYQCRYHEYMLRCFARHPYMWGTYVWNMFDFAADARDQGGEAGMNHKGLVTFDRATKKDAFYLYKAYWSSEPVLHIAGKRFVNRTGKKATLRVYSNVGTPELTVNGKACRGKTADGKVYVFKIPLYAATKVTASVGQMRDEADFCRVKKKDPAYVLHVKSQTQSWQK